MKHDSDPIEFKGSSKMYSDGISSTSSLVMKNTKDRDLRKLIKPILGDQEKRRP
jgi:hypothetical protein